ncbi:MAG: hypothetical protein BWX84_00692 [Verrucomicrobia bacterium ADurb.Bin118]|nr:MAG: hypothetical protein BWX84_00692 [Verrucomicrobia bacterium ADurb.Bin118]
MPGNRKIHLRPFAAPNPVPLHFLERIAPVNRIEVLEQTPRIGGDAQHPLTHRLADDGMAANFALAIHNFFIRQHRAERFAPPNGLLADVGEAMIIHQFAASLRFDFRGLLARRVVETEAQALQKCSPLPIHPLFGVLGKRLHQFRNGAGLVQICVEKTVVKLQENPLRPLKIIGVGGVHLARPIVAEAKALNLARERGDVLLRGDARMLAGLDRVLFGGQTKGVPAHRMQDVPTAGALVTGEDIRGGVTLRMPDVQPGPGGIRKHVEDVKLGR